MSKIDHLTEYKKSNLPSFNHHHTQEDIKLKYLLSNQLDSNRDIPFLRLFKSILIRLFWSNLLAPIREQVINSAYQCGKDDANHSLSKEVKENLHIIEEYKKIPR